MLLVEVIEEWVPADFVRLAEARERISHFRMSLLWSQLLRSYNTVGEYEGIWGTFSMQFPLAQSVLLCFVWTCGRVDWLVAGG